MPPGRNALAAAVIAQVVPALSRFADRGLPDIIARWPDYDALAGQTVRVDDARAAFDAEVLGLAIDGGLRVRTAQGECVLYSGGEIGGAHVGTPVNNAPRGCR